MIEIPIVPSDLRHEEFIIVAARALECTNYNINLLFKLFGARLQKNNVQIENINDRIRKAQSKIQNLTDAQEDIVLCAPLHYPSKHIFKEIIKPLPIMVENTNQISKYSANSKFDDYLFNPNEKLSFFRINSPKSATNPMQCSLPAKVEFVSNIFAFNCDEFAYNFPANLEKVRREKTIKMDHNKRITKQAQKKKALLAPAPPSLLRQNRKKATPAGNMKYIPATSGVPAIDIPFQLPNLRSTAISDVQKLEDFKSKTITGDINYIEKLPAVPKVVSNNDDVKQTAIKLDLVIQEASLSKEISMQIEPSASHPPGQTNSNLEIAQAKVIPPPPPPPPKTTIFSKVVDQSPIKISCDTHSELMEAIRNAGGVKGGRLRSLRNELPPDSVDATQKFGHRSTTGQANNLMSDLYNKLLLRRKGISGTSSPGDSLISHLSAVIPPPTQKKPYQYEVDEKDEDDDWAD